MSLTYTATQTTGILCMPAATKPASVPFPVASYAGAGAPDMKDNEAAEASTPTPTGTPVPASPANMTTSPQRAPVARFASVSTDALPLSTLVPPLPSLPSTPESASISPATHPSAAGGPPSDEERRASKRRYRHSLPVRSYSLGGLRDVAENQQAVVEEQLTDDETQKSPSGAQTCENSPDPADPEPAFGKLLGLPNPSKHSVYSSSSTSKDSHHHPSSVPSLVNSQTSMETTASMSSAAALAAAVQRGVSFSTISLGGSGQTTPRQEPLRANSAVHARLQRAKARKQQREAMASAVSLQTQGSSFDRFGASVDNVSSSHASRTPRRGGKDKDGVTYKYTAYYAEGNSPYLSRKISTKSGGPNTSRIFQNGGPVEHNLNASKADLSTVGRIRKVFGGNRGPSDKPFVPENKPPKVLRWVRSIARPFSEKTSD